MRLTYPRQPLSNTAGRRPHPTSLPALAQPSAPSTSRSRTHLPCDALFIIQSNRPSLSLRRRERLGERLQETAELAAPAVHQAAQACILGLEAGQLPPHCGQWPAYTPSAAVGSAQCCSAPPAWNFEYVGIRLFDAPIGTFLNLVLWVSLVNYAARMFCLSSKEANSFSVCLTV